MASRPITGNRREEAPALSLADLEYFAEGWGYDGEARMLAKSYLEKRRETTAHLLWFLTRRGMAECGTGELRAFLAYLRTSHEEPGGRFGNPHATRPLAASTVKHHYTMLRAFWNFVVESGGVETSPMATLKAPIARPDQIQPFSEEDQRALVAAARKSRFAERNTALVLFLLDTGARVSEVCALTYGQLAMSERCCRVEGKGGKERLVAFGTETAQALWGMLRHHPRQPDTPLFLAFSGPGRRVCHGLTRRAIRTLLIELGKAAGLKGVRVSPHTCRHSFALSFLRGGGDPHALQMLMGHSSPSTTARYISLAQADLLEQHRKSSPVDRLFRGKQRR
jgi:site-specific recombinase XerD